MMGEALEDFISLISRLLDEPISYMNHRICLQKPITEVPYDDPWNIWIGGMLDGNDTDSEEDKDFSTYSEQPGISRQYEFDNEYQSTKTEASLHGVVSNGSIERLSEASLDWRDIGRKLKISDDVLDRIQSDTIGGHQEKVYQMLKKWKQQNGSDATYKRLGDALIKCGRRDLQQGLEKEAEARSTVPTNQSVSFWATKNYGLRRFTTLEQRRECLYEKLVKQFTRITALMQKPSSLENNLKNNRFSHSRINKNERFFRRNNIRIVGFTTKDGENCLEVAKMVLNETGIKDCRLEWAHRVGKSVPNRDRHILVKLSSYKDKVTTLKHARKALSSKRYYIIDDLTKIDLAEKRKYKSEVQELFQQGTRLRFTGGCWRGSNGKPYNFGST